MAKPGTAAGETPLLEWVAGGIGAVLFLGCLSIMVWNALTPRSLPSLSASVGQVTQQANGFTAEFTLHNSGRSTAANVTVLATLKQGSEEVEQHEAMIDFVPPLSERKGGIFFKHDPRSGELTIEAQGYSDP